MDFRRKTDVKMFTVECSHSFNNTSEGNQESRSSLTKSRMPQLPRTYSHLLVLETRHPPYEKGHFVQMKQRVIGGSALGNVWEEVREKSISLSASSAT